MKIPKVYTVCLFYTVLFVFWSWSMRSAYGSFRFGGAPVPGDLDKSAFNAMLQGREIASNIELLKKAVVREGDRSERGHMLHSIGLGYSHLYRITHRKNLMDSALAHFERSVREESGVARFYYNMGRAFTEINDPERAKKHYEKAVALDSTYVVALHNLAILLYTEMKRPEEAQGYFRRLAAIDSTLPMIHYMMGEIERERGNADSAAVLFSREIALFSRSGYSEQLDSLPRSKAGEHYAAYMSHYRLGLLFASELGDPARAAAHLKKYMEMAPDEKERKRAASELRKLKRR
jgi:tetratricopeptide (TPR) repeat protein